MRCRQLPALHLVNNKSSRPVIDVYDIGGELVDRLGVGVDEGAHVNAPSSLTGARAR